MKQSLNLRINKTANWDLEFNLVKTIHSSKNTHTIYQDSYHLVIVRNGEEFMVGSQEGELKIFDTSTMIL
jgi:hypothetical protein